MNHWIKPGLINTDSLEGILNEVCQLTGTKPDDIKSKSRKQETVIVRQVYCYVAREITGETMEKIGNVINREHATVVHSCKVVGDAVAVGDRRVMEVLEKVRSVL
jgi:chromosomal replication initiator protein